MIMNTHLLITRLLIKDIFEDRLSPKQKRALLYGCVEPDLPLNRYLPRAITKNVAEHTVEETLIITEKMIITLYKKAPLEFLDDDYYQTLGKVIHYLSDYFCSAHSPWFIASTIKHLKYELKLHNELKANDMLYRHRLKNIEFQLCLSTDAFIAHFHKEQQRYRGSLSSTETDLMYVFSILKTFNALT